MHACLHNRALQHLLGEVDGEVGNKCLHPSEDGGLHEGGGDRVDGAVQHVVGVADGVVDCEGRCHDAVDDEETVLLGDDGVHALAGHLHGGNDVIIAIDGLDAVASFKGAGRQKGASQSKWRPGDRWSS